MFTDSLIQDVYSRANTDFYRHVLAALVSAMATHGWQFVPGSAIPSIDKSLLLCFADALQDARIQYVAPLMGDADRAQLVVRNREDGTSSVWLMGLLNAICANGYVPGPLLK